MKIFISYAHEDRHVAQEIALALHGGGHKVFIDVYSEKPGDEYHTRIRKYIATCHVFVYLISPDSILPGYSLSELEMAKNKWRDPWGHVLPVFVRSVPPTEIDPYLTTVNPLKPKGDVAAEVAAAIERLRRELIKRWVILVVIAALTAVIIAIIFRLLNQSPTIKEPPPEPKPRFEPDSTRIDKGGLEYVWIPPGSFQMGCSPNDHECNNDERPAHTVGITKGFWMTRTEVTLAAFKNYSNSTSAPIPQGQQGNNYPIVNITWFQAHTYCQWIGGRLPTEVEWEYAARGTNTDLRYGQLDDIAWYSGNTNGLMPTGSKEENSYRLRDMIGNAAEWIDDWYEEDAYQPHSGKTVPSHYSARGVRGGSYIDPAVVLRVSARSSQAPESYSDHVGFRCVLE